MKDKLFTLRSLCWPDDRSGLLALDTSFATDHIFRLERRNNEVTLEEVAVAPLLQKSYPFTIDHLPNHDWIQIAEHDNQVVGLAAMTIETWNRRAVLNHLYVTRAARGIGVGQALVTSALDAARELKVRCLWVETQTVNYPAVSFYRRAGFTWCGFDASLHDPKDVGVDEIALFLSHDLT